MNNYINKVDKIDKVDKDKVDKIDKKIAPDLSVNIGAVKLKNPVIAASGTFGFGREYSDFIDISRLGGICTKGLTFNPRPGNEGIRLWETASGLLNSIGLENPGIEAFLENELPWLSQKGTVIIANLSGSSSSIEEYEKGALLLDASSVDIIELNISCPNVKSGGMAFGLDPYAAGEVTSRVRRALKNKPLMVKLSPNVEPLLPIARACVNEGADALSLVNTFKAMAIDVQKRRSVFNNVSAGLSGPAIKPIALRMVWELCRENLGVPIVGLGGIATARDALEFLAAGALAIQVGTAVFVHPQTPIEIIEGIECYMRDFNIAKIKDIAI
jgi:dihydroorotate dehydrogenase (NAD+) catalytic subunit